MEGAADGEPPAGSASPPAPPPSSSGRFGGFAAMLKERATQGLSAIDTNLDKLNEKYMAMNHGVDERLQGAVEKAEGTGAAWQVCP